MEIECVVQFKERIPEEILNTHLGKEIKGRARLEIKNGQIHIHAKDLNAFKIAINSVIRILHAFESSQEI